MTARFCSDDAAHWKSTRQCPEQDLSDPDNVAIEISFRLQAERKPASLKCPKGEFAPPRSGPLDGRIRRPPPADKLAENPHKSYRKCPEQDLNLHEVALTRP